MRYRAAPLDPPGLAAGYGARQLSDSALRRFLTNSGIGVPDSEWHPRHLSLAALYFHPELDVARANWHEAAAAEITAGARPPLATDASVNRAARPDEGKSTTWSVSLGTAVTLETGGKRGARLARARAATLAARLRLETVAWQVAEDAANAGLNAASADRDLRSAEGERATLERVLALLRARYAQGAASLTEVARAEGDLQAATVGVLSAQRERTAVRAELARAVGLPVAQVDSLAIEVETASTCTVLDSVAVPALERRALRTRADVGMQLATYAEAEGELRIAVAEQYPDVSLGPGIGWEQGIGRWSLGLGLSKILLNRNRGPIGEAAARREGAALRFAEVQQNALREVASGAAECQGARLEAAQADTLFRGAARRLALARAAYERGETGETEVAFAQLGLVRTQHTRDLATRRLAAAHLGLERAVGGWLGASVPQWPDLTQPARPTVPDP
ncbi:MAG TPA: TolC family protein [Gemmatimonadales bacterium]|nr:TolC family protein [Gemmatimonadales bacterium]